MSASHRCFADRIEDFERLARVFENSGIIRRYAVRPLEWYLQPLGWPERNRAYLDGAMQLFIDAATGALDRAGIHASQVDTIVTVSSTGIATPSLEARVADRMGFRVDVERVPVFGLGCAGGVSGLSIASRLAQSRPGIVLLVAVELCTLAFRLDKLSKENIVATALFGDGAAACVLQAGEAGLAAVEMSGQHTWPDTLDIMGWDVDPQGHAGSLCRVRERAAVITGGSSHECRRLLSLGECEHDVPGAADLVGKSGLKCFELEIHILAART